MNGYAKSLGGNASLDLHLATPMLLRWCLSNLLALAHQIYYYSDSGSSGWGSDKDFDDLLAKQQRETGTRAPQEQSQFAPVDHAMPIEKTHIR